MMRNPDGVSSFFTNVASLERKNAREIERALATLEKSKIASLGQNSVVESIALRAAVNPNAVAVVERERSLNYRDLEAQSNQLARHLQTLGVEPEQLVGLYIERSSDYVLGALAILKAGGAYVPLDPSSPADHLRFMLNDAAAKLLLSRQSLAHRPLVGRWKTVNLDQAWPQVSSHSDSALESSPGPNQLAYVIYTSGSTGRPKGVEIEHRSLSNLAQWHVRAFNITPDDHASQFAGLGFDAAVWEIWANLAGGASLHLVNEDARREPETLRDWIVANRITVCFAPTPVAEHLIRLEWPASLALRVLLTGGDTLRRRPLPHLPFELINNYGPTECTVVSTSGRVSANRSDYEDTPSIGEPIDNTIIYILDDNRQPVITGQIGEIYIAGAAVARGYHNAADLTRRSFLNPFGDQPGDRCYKTGDLARCLPNGEIQFVGRADEQIEIRGHRLEPGEIAGVLNRHPEVRASVIVAHEDSFGDKHLIAYVVPTRGAQTEEGVLRSFLRTQLPAYMIPRYFRFVDEFPLNPSGKIDRSVLLSGPDGAATADATTVGALPPVADPQSDVMTRMSEIVASLLEVEHVSEDENFFLLGGHSLLGAQLIARVRESFGVELTLRALFDAPTVRELSALVSEQLHPTT